MCVCVCLIVCLSFCRADLENGASNLLRNIPSSSKVDNSFAIRFFKLHLELSNCLK